MKMPGKMKTPSLQINAISNWTSLFISIATGIFLTPFIIKHIDKSGYGIWVLVNSLTGYYGLLNLGVSAAITRYVSHYTALDDREGLNKVANSALAMFCVTGAVAVILSLLFSGSLASFFDVKQESFNDFKNLVIIIGLSIGISFPGEVFGAIILAREKFVQFNFISIIQTVLRAVLTVLFLVAGLNLMGVGLATLLPTFVLIAGYFVLFRHHAGDIKISFSYANFKTLGMLILFGGLMTIITLADTLRLSVTNFVIGKVLSLDAVAVFGVSALLIRYARGFITSAMWVLTPRFTNLHGKDDIQTLKELYLKSLTVSCILSFALCTSMIIFGPRFIKIWVGPGFYDAGIILIILSAVNAYSLAQNSGLSLMQAMNKHSFYAVISFFDAAVSIALSIVMAKKFGVIGVAYGLSIPMTVISLVVTPFYISWYVLDIKLWDNYKRLIISTIASGGIIVSMYYLNIIRMINECSVIMYFLTAGVYITAGSIIALYAHKYYKKSDVQA